MTLHTVCRTDELNVGHMKAFNIGGQKIVLYHLTDGQFAERNPPPIRRA